MSSVDYILNEIDLQKVASREKKLDPLIKL